MADKPAQLIELMIENQLGEISRVIARFDAFAEEHGIPDRVAWKIDMAFDELLNNIISYAYGDNDKHVIDVKIELYTDKLLVTIADDGIPFNPFSIAAPDTSLSLEEREIGGLGIHLVRNLVDATAYLRSLGKNIVTLEAYLQQ